LESIIADVGRHRQVTRATVYKALQQDREAQDRLASIAKEAFPRLQASQHALAEAKAALRAEKRRHSALCEQLRAEYGPGVLKDIDMMRKLRNKKERAKVRREIQGRNGSSPLAVADVEIGLAEHEGETEPCPIGRIPVSLDVSPLAHLEHEVAFHPNWMARRRSVGLELKPVHFFGGKTKRE